MGNLIEDNNAALKSYVDSAKQSMDVYYFCNKLLHDDWYTVKFTSSGSYVLMSNSL